ncbi:MAG: hypothetical protein CLLPBCKN_004908 [Chroococcidiopsis cubana SAG 39.79]|uniref:Uncharacterized protein n=1 Tax=Chroococcidiopsis cubana SAG 39.79 TaxID=388085 RepID=A0AB37UJJ1_9CYAN|nr:hypothetical protein [Chroococcidiopsis cubana]MDZ4875512.1 hypothetical protein [Chroococcidiopsis cubana SAG 39.79]RUT11570.1 hypothetical protein DSM107010_30570 [Chroococcidiopsis cubana SAG 39.79]
MSITRNCTFELLLSAADTVRAGVNLLRLIDQQYLETPFYGIRLAIRVSGEISIPIESTK